MNDTAPRLKAPPGTCDTHMHIYDARYPTAPTAAFTPPDASVADYLEVRTRLGITRTVVVQPSTYGTDNRCMLDSLQRLCGAGRGVAVLDESADDATLAELHAGAVRGLRFNVESAGLRDPRAVEGPLRRWADRIAPLGWHLQVYAAHTTIAELVPVLSGLPVPVVLDHFAMLPADAAADLGAARTVVELVRSGKAYVKLSAPYRVAANDPVAAATDLAHTFVEPNLLQVLWGSDWPHTNREPGKAAHDVSRYREVAPATLAESIASWLPTASLRQQVLVDNPARLYGF